jgi:hypothetical protein
MGRRVTLAGEGVQLSRTRQMVPPHPPQWVLWREAGYQYNLGQHFAKLSVAIGFDPDTRALICQPERSEETTLLAAQGLTKAELMGELAVLQALPVYPLALPFSLAAWRQLE